MSTASDPVDFTFVLPEDWVRVRLAEPEHERDLDTVTDLVTRGRPDRDSLGHEVRTALRSICLQARDDPHAVEVHLSFTRVGGFPLAAALTVAVVPPGPARATAADVVATFLARGAGADEVEVVDLPAGPAGRLRRTVEARLDRDHAWPTSTVQYLLVVPGTTGFVLLSFSTPLLALADQLSALFDAVARSFRWVRG